MNDIYTDREPSRAEVDTMAGATVLEFGASWCPICRGAQPAIHRAFEAHGDVRHLRIEDGPGRPLGRSFRVKLWPTLIFMKQGKEVARLVRPTDAASIDHALRQLA
ncbi:MAG TPA: thioredoxin family protein [Albitalea sp.]